MPFSLDAGSLMQILWLVLLIIFAASEAVTSGDRIVLTEKGFTLAAHSNVLPYPQPNLREDVYTYIAFR